MPADRAAVPWAFALRMEREFSSDSKELVKGTEVEGATFETQYYAAQTEAERDEWMKKLDDVITMRCQDVQTVVISKGLLKDYRDFQV